MLKIQQHGHNMVNHSFKINIMLYWFNLYYNIFNIFKNSERYLYIIFNRVYSTCTCI